MKTFEISGIIKREWDDFTKIKLIQSDGLSIDLINRFAEIVESFPNEQYQVSYYIADKKMSKDEIMTGFLYKLDGVIDAEYEKEEYYYSSWTNGVYYNSTLTVGGHDLLGELEEKDGKFIIIEINIGKDS